MFTYDPVRKEYRFWHFLLGGFVNQWSGQWDEAAKILSLHADIGNGITSTGTMHSIDKDHREFHAVAKDADGKVYHDIQGILTRRKSE